MVTNINSNKLLDFTTLYDFIYTFTYKHLTRISIAIFTGVSLLLVISLINIAITWNRDINLMHARRENLALSPIINKNPDALQKLADLHLFGRALKINDTDSLPITSLQLRLIGISRSLANNNSSVIISEASQGGKIYFIGDTLPYGVKVSAIADDGVILEHAGRLEKLPLPRQQLAFMDMPAKLFHED